MMSRPRSVVSFSDNGLTQRFQYCRRIGDGACHDFLHGFEAAILPYGRLTVGDEALRSNTEHSCRKRGASGYLSTTPIPTASGHRSLLSRCGAQRGTAAEIALRCLKTTLKF